jgi:hypothetical protein
VYVQGFVSSGGQRKALVVNKTPNEQAVTLAGAGGEPRRVRFECVIIHEILFVAGGTLLYIDESTGFGPAQPLKLPADTWTLAPYAVGMLLLPA